MPDDVAFYRESDGFSYNFTHQNISKVVKQNMKRECVEQDVEGRDEFNGKICELMKFLVVF